MSTKLQIQNTNTEQKKHFTKSIEDSRFQISKAFQSYEIEKKE